MSYGIQRDKRNTSFYPAENHRPWKISWANRIRLAGNYLISTELQHGSGYAYTPYTGSLNDAGGNGKPIEVGSKNSARFSAYSRMDLRIEKSARWKNQSFMTYFEVWNAFNHPNYFLRDSKSGRLKFPDLNLPFPFLFFGVDYKW